MLDELADRFSGIIVRIVDFLPTARDATALATVSHRCRNAVGDDRNRLRTQHRWQVSVRHAYLKNSAIKIAHDTHHITKRPLMSPDKVLECVRNREKKVFALPFDDLPLIDIDQSDIEILRGAAGMSWYSPDSGQAALAKRILRRMNAPVLKGCLQGVFDRIDDDSLEPIIDLIWNNNAQLKLSDASISCFIGWLLRSESELCRACKLILMYMKESDELNIR